MTAEKLINYLDNPESFDKNAFAEISQLVDQFSYFQTAHIMLLKNVEKFDKKNINERLAKSGIFVADRTHLFRMMKNAKQQTTPSKQKIKTSTQEKKTVISAPANTDKQKLEEQLRLIEQKTKTKSQEDTQKNTKDETNASTTKDKPVVTDENKSRYEKVTLQDDKTKQQQEQKITKTAAEPPKDEIKTQNKTKEHESLADTGTRTHNALLDDLFMGKVKKKDPDTKQSTESKDKDSELEKNKEKEISSQQLTNEIYNKIAGIKETRKPVKTLDINSENDTSKTQKNKKQISTDTEVKDKSETQNQTVIKEESTPKTEETKKEAINDAEIKQDSSELTAADKLVMRIRNLKKEQEKHTDTDEQLPENTDRKESEESDALSSTETVFELDNNKEEPTKTQEPENKSQPDTEKTAADSILERINKMKGKSEQKKEKLIEEFVKKEPRLDRKSTPEIEGDVSEDSTKEREPVVTELMANIYINQGYFDKAIEVFEKLILKNPEKKDYFAAKIQETEEMK